MSTPQKWLITGGAGYIGAHVADAFLADGKDVLIYDSLYQGLESRIEYLRKKHKKEIPLIVADIRNTVKFEEVLAEYVPHGVIHIAALKAVGESMEKPDEYFEVNYDATAKILQSLVKHEIHNFIFSSTAAVYGSPDHSNPIREDDPKNPISPYGASKLAAEEESNKFFLIPGNRGTSLRFFNAIGAASPELEDNSRDNLVPIVIEKVKAGQPPIIYGTDYPTPDGTCIRDYVDVRDIARAHLACVNSHLDLPPAMNIGSGIGHSVWEVISVISKAMGSFNLPSRETDRRVGDAAFVCADTTQIIKTLNFQTIFTLSESIDSIGLFGKRQHFKLRLRNKSPQIALKLYRTLRNKKNSFLRRTNNRRLCIKYSGLISERFPEFLQGINNGKVLDFGANVGHFSSACLDYGFEVIAVEPHPDALKQLKNRFKDSVQVEIIPMAVGADDGNIELLLHPDSKNDPITTSISASVIQDKFTGGSTSILVPKVAMSSFFSRGQVYELVKIDIEGAEFLLVPDLIRYSSQIKRLLLETHDRFMCDSVMASEYSENLKLLRKFIDNNNLSKRWLTDWV